MNKPVDKDLRDPKLRRKAPLATRTDLKAAATKDITAAMNTILADVFALYLKTNVLDNDAEYVEPLDMLAELREDNMELAARFREAHNVCDEHRDVATASLIEVWIDETERRTWFLFEASRKGGATGH